MKIVFLGTNGWYSTTTGLTPCVFIDSKDFYLILDAGEGVHKLDRYITNEEKPIYMFLSHFHLEHIHGLHILSKFSFKQGMKIFGKGGTKKMTETIMKQPFTMPINELPFKVEVEEFAEGVYEKPLKFSCRLLPHPDPSMGYRFEIEGKIVAYCTDTGVNENLLELAKDADVLIAECAHLPKQISDSWPHLNPEEAAKAAKEANVKKLILMHFAANNYESIEDRKRAEEIAKTVFKNTVAALDDMILTL